MNLNNPNNPMNSTVSFPNKEGMLITYFKTKKDQNLSRLLITFRGR
jgi:hypothetical protein